MQSTKNLLEGRTGQITQSVDAVKAFLSWKKMASNPLPPDVTLDNVRLVLVLSNKKDVYYTVTPTKCSCPAATYNPYLPCKHQRKHFSVKLEQTATASESIRPEGKWPGGLNGPVDECKGTA